LRDKKQSSKKSSAKSLKKNLPDISLVLSTRDIITDSQHPEVTSKIITEFQEFLKENGNKNNTEQSNNLEI